MLFQQKNPPPLVPPVKEKDRKPHARVPARTERNRREEAETEAGALKPMTGQGP